MKRYTSLACFGGSLVVAVWLFMLSNDGSHVEYEAVAQEMAFLTQCDSAMNSEVLRLKFQQRVNFDELLRIEEYISKFTIEARKCATPCQFLAAYCDRRREPDSKCLRAEVASRIGFQVEARHPAKFNCHL